MLRCHFLLFINKSCISLFGFENADNVLSHAIKSHANCISINALLQNLDKTTPNYVKQYALIKLIGVLHTQEI